MKLPAANIQYKTVKLSGGLDQITPVLEVPAGSLRASRNFEASVSGGYTRIVGYERRDGRTAPSSGTYSLAFVNAFTRTPTVGDTLLGATSGVTGVVLFVGSNHIAVTSATGVYTVGEQITVGGLLIATVVAVSQLTAKTRAIYKSLAADRLRTSITAVTGTGPILGVFSLNDIDYAFRADSGTPANMNLYKTTSSGWTLVPYLYEIAFTAGTTMPADGATLTQGGVTATIKRTCTSLGYNPLTAGWTAGAGAGRFIITAPAGGNFAAGAATASGGTTVTLSGVQTAITMLSGGTLETDQWNFFGGADNTRIYGADGVNRAFEFDGTTLVPISTGAATDTPSHVVCHQEMLMLMQGTSLQYSAIGAPYTFDATVFAGEIGLGGVGTGMLTLTGTQSTAALMITTRENTMILYGTDYQTFNRAPLNNGAGALPYTQQNLSQAYVFDDKGITSMQATLNYGNFDSATLTYNINKFIAEVRSKSPKTCINRAKSQYRMFFNDGQGLYVTIVNGKMAGAMPIATLHTFNCVWTGKRNNGEEVTLAGGTDGYVYQLDKGTSFDGQTIDASITLAPLHLGTPRQRKRFRKTALDVTGNTYFELRFGYVLGYQSNQISQSSEDLYSGSNAALQWDGFTWDDFVWDDSDVAPRECVMEGSAEVVALTLRSTTNYIESYTVNSATLRYSPRTNMR